MPPTETRERDMSGWMDKAMDELRPWIGRVRTTEDDVGLMAMRRAAGTFNMDPEGIGRGTELPPHWFALIGVEPVVQISVDCPEVETRP